MQISKVETPNIIKKKKKNFWKKNNSFKIIIPFNKFSCFNLIFIYIFA